MRQSRNEVFYFNTMQACFLKQRLLLQSTPRAFRSFCDERLLCKISNSVFTIISRIYIIINTNLDASIPSYVVRCYPTIPTCPISFFANYNFSEYPLFDFLLEVEFQIKLQKNK